jgi:hypothetical protein
MATRQVDKLLSRVPAAPFGAQVLMTRADEGWVAQSPSAWHRYERSPQQLNFRVRAATFPNM